MKQLERATAEVLTRYGADQAVAPMITVLLELLGTDTRAPTTIRDPTAALEAHVADALDGLAVPEVRAAEQLADLGSGAGFPGLVLAAVLPATRCVLVDSVGKKTVFVRDAAAAMGLENVEAVHARAEAWPGGLERFDVVTARAVAPLTTLVEYAAPVLRPDGVLVAYKGRRDPAEEADGAYAAGQTGLRLEGVVRGQPRVDADERHLHVLRKVAPTPARFPRREGMARKHPLIVTEHARNAR